MLASTRARGVCAGVGLGRNARAGHVMATMSSPFMRTVNTPAPESLAVHRSVSDTRAVISVRGLHDPLTVLHVSDSHIDVGPEPGRELQAEFMRGVNEAGLPDVTSMGVVTSAAVKLQAQLQMGEAAGAQLLAHTGDLVNFPSPKAVAQVQHLIEHSGISEFLYVSGNHDWAYSAGGGTGQLTGSAGSWVTQEEVGLVGLEAIRAKEIGGALAPLYQNRPGVAWTHDSGGLRFVGIDNSTYQVGVDQHAVLSAALNLEPGIVGVVR